MRGIYEFAEFLFSGWRLANPGHSLPIHDGKLDQALHNNMDGLPVKFKMILTFGTTRIGFRCYDLMDVLHAGYDNLLYPHQLQRISTRTS